MIPNSYVWLDCECLNCLGKFLFAEALDPDGLPEGEIICASCGDHIYPVTNVQPEDQS